MGYLGPPPANSLFPAELAEFAELFPFARTSYSAEINSQKAIASDCSVCELISSVRYAVYKVYFLRSLRVLRETKLP